MSSDDTPRESNLIITGGDGTHSAVAQQRMMLGIERRPCERCKSWGKEPVKMARHLAYCGMIVNPVTGDVTSPIHKDEKLRGLQLNVNNLGWCRFEMRVTENQATCKDWVPKDRLAAHLATQ